MYTWPVSVPSPTPGLPLPGQGAQFSLSSLGLSFPICNMGLGVPPWQDGGAVNRVLTQISVTWCLGHSKPMHRYQGPTVHVHKTHRSAPKLQRPPPTFS